MRDYDELVRRLRDSADWADHFAVLMGRVDGDVHAPIMREAAEAIEKLYAALKANPNDAIVGAQTWAQLLKQGGDE